MNDSLDVPTPEAVCVHRWMLESPAHGVTSGRCRECGVTRQFVESFGPLDGRWRGRKP